MRTWERAREQQVTYLGIHRQQSPKSFPNGHWGVCPTRQRRLWCVSRRTASREKKETDAAYMGEARRRERRRETEAMTGKVWVGLADYWHIFLPGRGADERNLEGLQWRGRRPPSISYSTSQDIDAKNFILQAIRGHVPSSLMAAAQFLKHGKKVTLSSPILDGLSPLHACRSSPSVATISTTSRNSTTRSRKNPSSSSSRPHRTCHPKRLVRK